MTAYDKIIQVPSKSGFIKSNINLDDELPAPTHRVYSSENPDRTLFKGSFEECQDYIDYYSIHYKKCWYATYKLFLSSYLPPLGYNKI